MCGEFLSMIPSGSYHYVTCHNEDSLLSLTAWTQKWGAKPDYDGEKSSWNSVKLRLAKKRSHQCCSFSFWFQQWPQASSAWKGSHPLMEVIMLDQHFRKYPSLRRQSDRNLDSVLRSKWKRLDVYNNDTIFFYLTTILWKSREILQRPKILCLLSEKRKNFY